MVHALDGSLAGWLAGSSAGWLAGLFSGWLVGWVGATVPFMGELSWVAVTTSLSFKHDLWPPRQTHIFIGSQQKGKARSRPAANINKDGRLRFADGASLPCLLARGHPLVGE